MMLEGVIFIAVISVGFVVHTTDCVSVVIVVVNIVPINSIVGGDQRRCAFVRVMISVLV